MKPKRIKELPDFDRPREKLTLKGPKALSDAELLAILLGSGTKGRSALELASAILKKLGSRLDQLQVEDLKSFEGIGQAKACQVLAAFELARRHLLRERYPIRQPEDALPYLQHIADKKQEYFICLTLNGAREVIESRVVTVGLVDSSQIHPREVFADAIADRAAAILVAHNHPSGALEPSPEDLALTRQLVEAGKIMGIEVLDHIIVTKRGHISLNKQGYM